MLDFMMLTWKYVNLILGKQLEGKKNVLTPVFSLVDPLLLKHPYQQSAYRQFA